MWYFIRQNDFEWTIKCAELLRDDSHDLMHKAVGWMLRELGKRDEPLLISFLNHHAPHMPRAMLRYSIERLTKDQRTFYLSLCGKNNHE